MLKELLYNHEFMVSLMAVVIFLSTFVIKYPIKLATKHIGNERKRKMANAVILLVPFALGVLFDFLYTKYVIADPFSVLRGLGYGTAAISLYGIVERFFKVKVPNPYETEEGKAVKALVDKVSEDGKVDENDKDAVTEFLNMVK